MSSFKTVSKRSLTQGGVTVNSFYASAAVPCPTGAFDNSCNANGVYAGCYLTAEYADNRYLLKSRDDTVPEGTTETFLGPVVIHGGLLCDSEASFDSISTNFIDASSSNLYLGTVNTDTIVLGNYSSTVNLMGNIQYNDTLGTEGQVLTISDSFPIWKTPESIGSTSGLTQTEADARYVQLNAVITTNTIYTNIVVAKTDTSDLHLGDSKTASVYIGDSTIPVLVYGNFYVKTISGTEQTLNIGNYSTGNNVSIGHSNKEVAITGKSVIINGEKIYLYAPPTPNYIYPPSVGQIGHKIFVSAPTVTITETFTYVNIASVDVGIENVSTWYIEYQGQINQVNTGTQTISISDIIDGASALMPMTSCLTPTVYQRVRISGMVQINAGSTIYIHMYTSLLNQVIQNAFVQATRIA